MTGTAHGILNDQYGPVSSRNVDRRRRDGFSRQLCQSHHALLGRQVRTHGEPAMVSAEWFTNGRRATRILAAFLSGWWTRPTGKPSILHHQAQGDDLPLPRRTGAATWAIHPPHLSLDWNTRLTRVGRVRCQSSPVHGPA